MNKKTNFFIFLIGLYLISTGSSYAFFNYTKAGENISDGSLISPTKTISGAPINKDDPVLFGPKDQQCPINGAMLTKTEKELWEKRRPLLVMIENHEDSRPQSGLSRADIVYEAIAEGGITRFMGVFYCANAAYAMKDKYDLGPVRSARTYFVDIASEYSDYPLYTHVGGAGQCIDPTVATPAKALCQIEKYGWKNKGTWGDLDQFALGFKVCRREPDRTGKEVATEHTMYCSSEALWSTAALRGLTNMTIVNEKSWDKSFRQWAFKDDSPSSGSVSPSIKFWQNKEKYDVKWEYDKTSNSYKRINGGEPVIDFNNKQQIKAKTVIVQTVSEKGPVDEHKHMLYGVIDTGKAVIFQDGQSIEARWTKKSRQERTVYVDNSGKEIKFNRGLIWIELLPSTGTITQ